MLSFQQGRAPSKFQRFQVVRHTESCSAMNAKVQRTCLGSYRHHPRPSALGTVIPHSKQEFFFDSSASKAWRS
jgi:hypothetical protein